MARTAPWVLGISASHNGACCLLHGDEIVVAVQEERLVGRKRARIRAARPFLALRYCLDAAGIEVGDLSMVVVSSQGPADSASDDLRLNPDFRSVPLLPTMAVPHHLAHAASALACSGFDHAAVLVVDGLGSPVADWDAAGRAAVVGPVDDGWEHASLLAADGSDIAPIEIHSVADGRWLTKHPDRMWDFFTLGGMFAAASKQIFGDQEEAGKVMGLAAYGTPTIPPDALVCADGDKFVFPNLVQPEYVQQARWPDHPPEYQTLAASVQFALEEALVHTAARLRSATGERRLCFAGGVALNSVANEAVLRRSGFDDLYVVPAAEDSGPAVGAAFLGLWALEGRRTARAVRTDSLGAVYPPDTVDEAIRSVPDIVAHGPADVLSEVVERLVRGEIGAWFDGGSELGPRALGHRSIICAPMGADTKARLNARVKFREMFRPFAPAVLREEAGDWFDFAGTSHDSPFMLRVVPFRTERRDAVPAVVHHDGTGRLQTLTRDENGRFFELVSRFHQRTGVPILLNTSLNVAGEPIAERPEDALWCLLGTGLDFCVIGDRVVTKRPGFGSVLDYVPRVVARDCLVSFPVRGGSIELRLDRDNEFTVRTTTPYGEVDVALSPRLFVLLSVIDGRSDGHAVRAALAGEPSEHEVVRDLLVLRRMGALAFGAAEEGGSGDRGD